MWIKEHRDELKKVVETVKDRAYWSHCNADVLFQVAVLCADGARALGHTTVQNPRKGKDQGTYKDWIVKLAHKVWWWLNDLEFLDCTLSKAGTDFENALLGLDDCRVPENEIESE